MCATYDAARLVARAKQRETQMAVLNAWVSALIRELFAKWCSMSCRLHQSEEAMHSGAARLGVCTNLGKLCTVVLHVLASAPIKRYYAQCFYTHWRLYQSGNTMPGDSGRLDFCTNQGGVVHNGFARVGVCFIKRAVCTVALHVLASVPISWMHTERF